MNSMFKASDLLSMAEKGILEYEGINISEIVVQAVYGASRMVEESHQAELDKAYDRGYDEGQAEQAAEIRAIIG